MKVLLLDADGVLLQSGELFSERFAREYQVPSEAVLAFFRGPFGDCQEGTKDLKEELPPYLETWGWTKGVDAFLDYWFESDTIFDEAVCEAVEKLKAKGVNCYLASNNEKYRALDLWRRIDERGLLDGHFFSYEVQTKKDNPSFFQKILRELAITPAEVCFVDDDERNVAAAKSVGIEAYLYDDRVLEMLLAKL